jgi:uncharacterized protein YqhQ
MAKERLPSYGGQALIEGVLMRGSQTVAAAMRSPEGKIEIHTEKLSGIYRSGLRKTPFLRGLIILWDAIVLGSHFLTLSANLQTGEEEKIEGPALYATLGFSLLVGLGIFVVGPSALGSGIERWTGLAIGWVDLIEGAIRLFVAVGYIWLIGRMPDISRVFAYHGAEHKTINAYEARAELTPEIVKHYSLEHPRCGTGFLLTVVIFSILIFSPLRPLTFWVRVPLQVVLVPVIACLAYEYMRWTADHLEFRWVRALIWPNLAMQHLTTREPTLDMLEVSIASFNAMIEAETASAQEEKANILQPQNA